MTIRLYWEDSYSKEFSGNVLQTTKVHGKPAAILDRTLFYPTSGGQPYDTGMLGSAHVVQVEEDASGTILHFLDSTPPLGAVSGTIDWERRFDHMQQHTGQHILSQAFHRVAGAPTVSFHMGVETCTIDIELAQPSESIMQESEELASRVVFENRPVRVLKAQRKELETLGVRKEPQREGEIRIIDVEDFDRSPCGGTHVRQSGEIGVIGILGFERYKGGARVEFVCGGRALRTLRKDHQTLKQIGKVYSGHIYELPGLAEKMSRDRAALARQNARLQDEMLEVEARDLLLHAEPARNFVVVRETFSGRSLDSAKALALKLASHERVLAILGLRQDPAQAVVARSNNIKGDCGAAVRRTAAEHGGRGGGRPELAQAGGIPAESLAGWLAAIEGYFKE